jgi:hypothetical protein
MTLAGPTTTASRASLPLKPREMHKQVRKDAERRTKSIASAPKLESSFSRTRKGLQFDSSNQCSRELEGRLFAGLALISMCGELETGLLGHSFPQQGCGYVSPERLSPPNGGLTP